VVAPDKGVAAPLLDEHPPILRLVAMLQQARTDLSMWLGLVYLLIVGAGTRSLDACLTSG